MTVLRATTIASLLLAGLVTSTSFCSAREPQTLMQMIAQWQYPGSEFNGASMSDAATMNASGERTLQSMQCKTVMTTTDPIDKVVAYYKDKLAAPEKNSDRNSDENAKPGDEDANPVPESGRSVTFHEDSEDRPLAIQMILINTEKASTTLVISRAEMESATHIAWSHYLRL